jgi:hypothetical protein
MPNAGGTPPGRAASPGTPPQTADESDRAWYTIGPRNKKNAAKFSTRSVYAVYQYLGTLLELSKYDQTKQIPFITIPSPNSQLIQIETNSTTECFVQINYDFVNYCVPKEAKNMKQVFAILHQVAGLNIAHAQTPGTLTVRPVP